MKIKILSAEKIKNLVCLARSLGSFPDKPVKGRGNSRHYFSFDFRSERWAADFWRAIPEEHKYQSNYRGIARYISNEANDILEPFLAEEKAAQWKEAYLDERKRRVQLEADNNLLKLKLALLESNLKAEFDDVKAWKLAGCEHPAPVGVAAAKEASGLSWEQFEEAL